MQWCKYKHYFEKWAYSSGSETIQAETRQFKSVAGTGKSSEIVFLQIFSPILETKYKFLVYDFHEYFDGIIGNKILFAKNFNLINLITRRIEITKPDNRIHTIPLHFYYPREIRCEDNSVSVPQTLDYNTHIAHLTHEEREALVSVLNQYSSIFHEQNSKLTCTTNVECRIRTTDDSPVYQKSYPYPVAYKKEVEDQISKLLHDGIIRPSRSAWNSPLWVVPKKHNHSGEQKFRLVVDYRKLNQKTISERYPMPEIQNILDQLGGNKYFSTLDLASSFQQIKVNEADVEKTAFSINSGKYEFLRMPFGLKNAPVIFQRALDDIFREHIGKICYEYIRGRFSSLWKRFCRPYTKFELNSVHIRESKSQSSIWKI